MAGIPGQATGIPPQRQVARNADVQEELFRELPISTGNAPEPVTICHPMVTNGQTTERQISERARDHFYN
jgi:hypothetical protein